MKCNSPSRVSFEKLKEEENGLKLVLFSDVCNSEVANMSLKGKKAPMS